MKFSLSALKKYLKTDLSAAQIADALSLLGLEIEEMEDASAPLAGFIVGEIVSVKKHPSADRLHLLEVSAGGPELVQVVCGAPNVKKGLKGIFARPGDRIPATGEVLKVGEIRGVKSFGMMCSARELGLGDDHDGIIELKDAAPGEPAVAALSRRFDFDVVYDAEVTPNRPDYLGVMGIARDLAAGGYGTFAPPETPKIPMTFKSSIEVENRAPEAAKYFNMQQIRGIANSPSPPHISSYLRRLGMASHNAVVDISNVLMIDMNRPLHMFDADKIKGRVVVDLARKGEKFVALDGAEYKLDDGDIVIRDDSGVISLAGIMGGASTAVGMDTKNILMECAYFDPATIRRTARRLGMESDAKYRFERGVDPSGCDWGLPFAARYVLEICGGAASEIISTGKNPYRDTPLTFPVAFFKQRIGIDLDKETMVKILSALGCVVSDKKDKLWITPPSWRADIAIKEDICEEICRIYGYDKLPEKQVLPESIRPALSIAKARESAVGRALAARGLMEVCSWSFMSGAKKLDAGPCIKLANPITAELDVMRESMVPNLLDAVAWNNARSSGASNAMAKNLDCLGFFEVGPVFHGAKPGEQRTFASAIRSGFANDKSWEAARRDLDIYDIKADLFAALALYGVDESGVEFDTKNLPAWVNPHAGAEVLLGGRKIAIFGEIHPLVCKRFDAAPSVFFELDLSALPEGERVSAAKPPLARSDLQPLSRDFSIVVQGAISARGIWDALRAALPEIVRDIAIFDIYGNQGEGKKAVGITLLIQPQDKNLGDKEIAALVSDATKALEKIGAKLRS